MVGNCADNNDGKAGALSAAERDAMATFLMSVPYPPAQRRAYNNVLSSRAHDGFRLFHIDGDLQGDPEPNVCGDCHRMPFWVTTNTPGTGMDAPTWRGAYDRWLILPQGRVNIIDFNFYRNITTLGVPEERMWQFSWVSRPRFDPVSAGEGGVVLQGEGLFIDGTTITPVTLQFDAPFQGGTYVARDGDREAFSRDALLTRAAAGEFVGTFTARLGPNVDVDNPQPAIWAPGAIQLQSGPQRFPVLSASSPNMVIRGRHIRDGANIIVDGRRVAGTVSCEIGTLPDCASESIQVQLQTLPAAGMHFLQIQNPNGLFSNDFIFHRE
jgi:hypothetical protein